MSNYEFFYPGTSYSLDAKYGDIFTGYRMSAGQLGMATDPRTANQLQEISNKLSVGTKIMETGNVQATEFESIPQQHLKEIDRLSKLTGVDITVHAPLVEPSGFDKNGWDEASRMQAERQMFSALSRSHEINPKGNVPVTFHSSAQLPLGEDKVIEKGKEVSKSMWVVDSRTGEARSIKETERFFPGEPEKFNPEQELKKINEESWVKTLNDLNFHASRAEDSINYGIKNLQGKESKESEADALKLYADPNRDATIKKLEEKGFSAATAMKEGFRYLDHGSISLRDAYIQLKALYDRVYKETTGEDKKLLDNYKAEIKPLVEDQTIAKDPLKMKQFADVIEKGIRVLKSIDHPELFIPFDKFIIDKTSDTFSNVALQAYGEFGEKAPTIAIENPPYGGALSRAEDLKELIEKSRKKFVEKAVKEGASKSDAQNAAEKLIGATWDVGHINMMRKYGYEKKDLIKQAETIKPFLKKVHLSDNFGFEHTELPMGMGNVPIKEIMEKLGKEGFEAKKIIEAGNWFQHFKTPPFTQSLEAFGSPLYSMKAPYWNQASNTYGNYFAFPSAYLPEQHFSLYGGGFSSLPTELGGQMPGKQSRVSGTPMD